MRIGIDLRLPTYQMGGISQYALHLLPALAALQTKHNFIVFHSRKEERSFLPSGNENFRRKNVWTPCHHRIERWTLGSEILPYGLDVFHSPDFIPPAWGAKRKIITIHDLNFVYHPQFLTAGSRRYYLDQIQWAAETADHISADSEATRSDIIHMLGIADDKVTAVHLAANPIYQQQFTAEEIAQTLHKHDLQPGYILFVGTLEPRKNLPMLIKAFDRLRREKGLQQPLILVGALGWETEEIFETITILNLEQHVRHLEGIYDRELAHIYHGAGVLVTPSHYEGFGLPALEAQHCHCPVVVSNRGSLPEIVGENGIMLDPDNMDLWVETLGRVLSDDTLRQEMIKNGRQQARQFSWEKCARQTMWLYEGFS
jgi:glycosyltransferase involved in cell wall biosynthesis